MKNGNCSQGSDLSARPSPSPAKVYFLHVGKKLRIESPLIKKVLRSSHQTRTRSPIDIHGIVILATVMLQRVPYPTPAVWISEGIEIASACARVVKGLAILPRKNLRLKCSVVRMLFQPIDHGCIPIRGDLHIRIEQY